MKRPAYIIEGGNPVKGEITALGAKNFATKAMVAALLTDEPTTLTNIPDIGDITITADMLRGIGATLSMDSDALALTIEPAAIKSSHVTLPDSGSNRIPILLLSALLQRFDEVRVPILGGCNIGARKVDFHIDAIIKFGGEVIDTPEGYVAKRTGRLQGAVIDLPYPSVGATETALYLSVLAEGRSVIRNAAMEPEIFELVTMLRSMGAIIFSGAEREFRIEGVEKLKGTTMPILGDRIEAASWAALACASDGDITVHGIRPDTMGNFLAYYRQVGGGFQLVGTDSIRFYRERDLTPAMIETDVYPGFSTDWQQPFAILLLKSHGVSIIHETVYENRLGYLKDLKKLGAKVQITTHALGSIKNRYADGNHEISAIISGPCNLKAVEEPLRIPDLRAGLAYVIAAAMAEGKTTIVGIENIERGYGNIVPRLTRMNLKIEKVFLS
jgi:UDP-N-acetylglucosamine 1-carboxyvinyltransferase